MLFIEPFQSLIGQVAIYKGLCSLHPASRSEKIGGKWSGRGGDKVRGKGDERREWRVNGMGWV